MVIYLNVNFITMKTECTPHLLYQSLRQMVNHSFLLESGAGYKSRADTSMIGFSPTKIISLDLESSGSDSFSILRKEIEHYKIENDGKYLGGLVGVFSYDAFRSIEKLPDNCPKDKKFPDALFGLFLDGVIFDHVKDTVTYFYHENSKNRVEFVSDVIEQLNEQKRREKLENGPSTAFSFDKIDYEISKDEYMKKVLEIKEKIEEGETFQTVFSQRLSTEYEGDPFSVYLKLREINPSPYLFFIELNDFKVFGASPETLVSVHERIARTFPIAGTRKLGTAAEQEMLMNDLLTDPKELAEHNMLVDLGRNDLGKVCQFGSIHVPKYLEVQKFSHVIHLVSIVEGTLKQDKDSFDAFKAVFPAGTVSGAPKIRSMEIIDDMEKMRRGPYAGAVGYFSLNGGMDLAIAIRTFYTVNNRLYFQAGGGIVMDSDPAKEYEESLQKLQALITSLKLTKNKGEIA